MDYSSILHPQCSSRQTSPRNLEFRSFCRLSLEVELGGPMHLPVPGYPGQASTTHIHCSGFINNDDDIRGDLSNKNQPHQQKQFLYSFCQHFTTRRFALISFPHVSTHSSFSGTILNQEPSSWHLWWCQALVLWPACPWCPGWVLLRVLEEARCLDTGAHFHPVLSGDVAMLSHCPGSGEGGCHWAHWSTHGKEEDPVGPNSLLSPPGCTTILAWARHPMQALQEQPSKAAHWPQDWFPSRLKYPLWMVLS